MPFITKENAGSCILFRRCAENKLSLRNKIGGRGSGPSQAQLQKETSLISACQPFAANADPALFAMKNGVNDNSNKVHGPFGLSVFESSAVIWDQSATP